MEYKVITNSNKLLRNKISPESIEEVLNQFGSEGWKVLGVTTYEFPGFGKRHDIVFVLGREK